MGKAKLKDSHFKPRFDQFLAGAGARDSFRSVLCEQQDRTSG
jgi:hypothetical protein